MARMYCERRRRRSSDWGRNRDYTCKKIGEKEERGCDEVGGLIFVDAYSRK